MSNLQIILTPEQLAELAVHVANQIAPALLQRQLDEVQMTDRIDPMRLYPVREAADYLGITEGTLYNLSEQELPRQGCGRGGGKVKFYGRDLIAFLTRSYTGSVHPHAVSQEESRRPAPILVHTANKPDRVRR